MQPIRIATAQFEHRSRDKSYNLDCIDALAAEAAGKGAMAVAFHECSITGYVFARHLDLEQMLDLAEYIPGGPSLERLTEIAKKYRIQVLAGLFEKDREGKVYKAYVCVGADGLVARFRKLHPFINPHLTPGNQYCIFDLQGWKCGILICYDNNIIENVRATTLLGADLIFMPHVTMCTPAPRPGAGFVDPGLWKNRQRDPETLRREFDGPKGREWLLKWLPARAFDNGIFLVFSNPVGMDEDQLKNGCSMIIDPFGDILAECRSLENEVVVADCDPFKLQHAGGRRYRNARRPELYREILGRDHRSVQKVAWMQEEQSPNPKG
ncbi:MAG TPA: nitrilase family protein [Chitinophagaceae bacterium]|nr:nitrilase family protein [Chitinophagaceae bacterium]